LKRFEQGSLAPVAAGVFVSLLLASGPATAKAGLRAPSPLDQQELPNMGQQITPFAPEGAT
jgi:hypothetical protein